MTRFPLRARSAGQRVILRWRPVSDATDYEVYLDDGFEGIEDTLTDGDVGHDGWFHFYTGVAHGAVRVWVVALDAQGAACARSERAQVNLLG